MLLTAARRARPGFTLVELMVAAAVCVLIMAILAGAFSLGIDTYRQMKSSGDMMDQLRGAGTAMKADLAAYHLMDGDGTRKKLSEIRADQTTVTDNGMGGPPYTVSGWKCPTNGFVRICSSPFNYPGPGTLTDADGLNAGTGIATTHYLHFTSILTGNSDDEYFRAAVPQNGQTYHSIAAEIAWFLEPMPSTGTGPTLHRLIRRQRLCALSDTDRRDRPWPNIADEAVISLRRPDPKTTYLSTLAELTNPSNRLGGTKWLSATNQVGVAYAFKGSPAQDDVLAPMASRPGEDTVLSNVISFEVQVQWTGASLKDLPYANRQNPDVFDTSKGKTDDPFDTLPVVPSTWHREPGMPPPPTLADTHTYDSWTPDLDWTTNYDPTKADARRPPLVITVRAVQVRIRIWDPKMQTGRQVSFVQHL